MTLNKTGIEWCDYTWNPVTGCKHGCSYCYARKIAERFKGTKAWPNGFEPTLHPERTADPAKMKKPQTIFVCSMADLFGEWVSDLWIAQVITACDLAPWHTYIFLTKNPKRYLNLPIKYFNKKNRWFGTTVTNAYDYGQRVHWLQRLPKANTFVSFEPLLSDPNSGGSVCTLNLKSISQIIIGAQTNPLLLPPAMAEANVYYAARRDGAKVFYKDSIVKCHDPNCTYSRELCWEIHK